MSQPARLTPASDHLHPAEEVCPYCDQAIPNERALEIRTRFETKRKQDEATLEAEMNRQLLAKSAELEAAKNAEVETLKTANAEALAKSQELALAQQAEAREEGKKLASEEAQQTISKILADKEATTLTLEELREQKATAEAQVQTLTAERDATIAARTLEVRTALEKAKTEEINTLSANHAEEKSKLSTQVAALQKQLKSEVGEGAAVNLYEELRKKFPKDEITKINKSSGADIRHVVMHNKKVCGKILYDSRNRNLWQATFAANLRKDMITEKADHAILTTSKFPKDGKHICPWEGIIAANPARVAVLAEIFRDEIVRNRTQRVSEQDKERKTAKLYTYIASNDFTKFLKTLDGNDVKLLTLDEEEKSAHTAMWKKRGNLLKETQRLHGNLRVDIDRIVGTSDQD